MQNQPVPLRDYIQSLGRTPQERAKAMTEVCKKADISYGHLKLVATKHRRLGTDAAFRLVQASGNAIDINDLIVPKSQLRS